MPPPLNLSPSSRKAYEARRKADWRRRIASGTNNSRDNKQFTNTTIDSISSTANIQPNISDTTSQEYEPLNNTEQSDNTQEGDLEPQSPMIIDEPDKEVGNQGSFSPSYQPHYESDQESRDSFDIEEEEEHEEEEDEEEETGHNNADDEDEWHIIESDDEEPRAVSEETAEEQLQRELSASSDPADGEVDIPLELGLHLLRFHGCDEGKHRQTQRTHFREGHPENHYSLDSINTITGQLPDVISEPKIMTSNSQHRKIRVDWTQAFEGRLDLDDDESIGEIEDQPSRIHVCLDSSEQPSQESDVKYDTDSFVGFAESLALARRGLSINLSPKFHNNIRTNLHVGLEIRHDFGRGEVPIWVKVHMIPHYCAGRVIGDEDTRIYFVFPRQWSPDKPTNFPGKLNQRKHGVLEKWTDEILLPAVAPFITSTTAQHLPPSFRTARFSAQAHSREATARGDKKDARSRTWHHTFQPHTLGPLWREILRRVELPGNELYRDVQLLFSSKNTKVLYKYNTLAETWDVLHERLQYIFNLEHIQPERMWIDWGKESACRHWAFPTMDLPAGSTPAVYLWRPCCLESFSKWALFGEHPEYMKKDIYYTAMLQDSYDLFIEMSKFSKKRKQGWVSSQLYNSFKEMFDLGKTKPFRGPFLDQLTWDPMVRTMIEKEGKAITSTPAQLRDSYCDSKARLYDCFQKCERMSYGIREEHRISLAFFYRMKSSLERLGKWNSTPVVDEDNRPYWQISNRTFTAFLMYNLNKFLLAFEWILTSAKDGYVSFEQTKVLTMLLHSIKYCYDSARISEDSGLWKDVYQTRGGGRSEGMGIQKTMQESGYAWYLPKIDWERMVFRSEVSDQMLYTDTALRDSYRKRWAAVKNVKDDLKKIETVGRWLELYQSVEEIQKFLFRFLVTLVIRSFRKDVFESMKLDIRPEFRKAALAGDIMLCWNSLRKVLRPRANGSIPIYIAPGNRTKVRDVRSISNLLWDFDDGMERRRWEKRRYRGLHQRMLQVVRIHSGASAAAELHGEIKRKFLLTNWLLPYPNTERFWQKHNGDRRWLSVYHREFVKAKYRNAEVEFKRLEKECRDRRWGFWRGDKVVYEKIYMMGWELEGEGAGATMEGIPLDSSEILYGEDVDMEQLEESLEEIWIEKNGG